MLVFSRNRGQSLIVEDTHNGERISVELLAVTRGNVLLSVECCSRWEVIEEEKLDTERRQGGTGLDSS